MRYACLCEIRQYFDGLQWIAEHTEIACIDDRCSNTRITFEVFVEASEEGLIPGAIHIGDGNVRW